MIACKACGDFVENELIERERAYAIITGVVASHLIGERKGGAQRVACEILEALKSAGLTIHRA
ncbi:hypothetical protein FBZ96_105649 [Bradyrhizobium stylosanthis]|uniref:Uncharacterized protein n=1 Tax=Bradyrhizobium stylosanthis TaxID=1803665 RepID=A0A560DPF2_9BRAD|nr:hypothetical protein FBZ96_105649 [Bradyrhizobium stylosanthis]